MKKTITFDELFDEAKGTEALEIEQLGFEVSHQFTERLAVLVEERGMSQRKLARELGVSDAYVSKILHGQPNMTLATIVKLARALGCRVLPPKIVARDATKTTNVLAETEVSKNTPRFWKDVAASVPSNEPGRPTVVAKRSGDGNVASTAA